MAIAEGIIKRRGASFYSWAMECVNLQFKIWMAISLPSRNPP